MGCVSSKDSGVNGGNHTAPAKAKGEAGEKRVPNGKDPNVPPEVRRIQTSSCGIAGLHKQQDINDVQEHNDERIRDAGDQQNRKKKRKKKKKKIKSERKKDQPIPLSIFATAVITGSKSDNQLREMLKYMNAHETDELTQTSLMIVARCGRKNLAADLLAMGAPVEAQDKDGQTALHLAAYFGYVDIVEQLATAGGASCINIQDYSGNTPLHRCIQIEENERIVLHLIQGGAKLDIKNNLGLVPLDVAPTTEYKERVLKLFNDYKS